MVRKYIIVADDSIKGFDEEIAKLEREWGAEEIEPCEDMRDATEEERKSTKDYIDSISKPTGLRFDDLYEEIDFVQSHNKIPCTITIVKPSEDCISREEAIKKLKALSWTNYDLDDAAEVLKRLPSVQPKTDILDKIRTEIEDQKKERCFDDDDMFVYRTGLDDALYIIDKYKEESEEH